MPSYCLNMWSAMARLKAYCMSVSTFIFTTPYSSASWISPSVEPEPPWKTSEKRARLPCARTTAS